MWDICLSTPFPRLLLSLCVLTGHRYLGFDLLNLALVT